MGSAGVPPASGGILPPPEAQATYGYSATTGRLETVSNGTATFRYDYLANSSLIEHVVATAGAVHDVHLTYEPTRNVLASRQNKVGTDVISQYDYTVNSLGQRSAVAQVGTAFQAVRAIAWQYDSLGQVIQADSSENTHDRAYQYDTIGNRLQGSAGVPPASTETTYLPNALNQYQTITTGGAPLSPAYDFDGNMTSGPLPAAPTTSSTLVWDAENRLIETTVGTNGPLVQNYYDSQSRRIATTSGGETTVYVYDSWNCIAEYSIQNSTFSIQHANLWGLDLSGTIQGAGGVGGLLSVSLITNNSITDNFFPTFDGNGNVCEYLTSTGTVAAHFEYDPFGNTVVNTDTANQFAYRFSTKPQDSTTGLLYYGYRFYDPVTGRWPSRDPIEERGGVNLYGLVGNDGVDRVDIEGRSPFPGGGNPFNPPNPPNPLPTPDGRRAELQIKFDKWYNDQIKKLDQFKNLPNCPCFVKRLTVTRGYGCLGGPTGSWEETVITVDGFTNVGKPNPVYHPGGEYDFRQDGTGGGVGQQCIYDKDGKLITEPPGAGTADVSSPPLGVIGHVINDVNPFHWALELDGDPNKPNKYGEYLKKYYRVRPANKGIGCEKNPK